MSSSILHSSGFNCACPTLGDFAKEADANVVWICAASLWSRSGGARIGCRLGKYRAFAPSELPDALEHDQRRSGDLDVGPGERIEQGEAAPSSYILPSRQFGGTIGSGLISVRQRQGFARDLAGTWRRPSYLVTVF